jgi:hypothetical protein
MTSFSAMRKTYAQGAWDMITAHYGEQKQFRLVVDNKGPLEIIDTWDSPRVGGCNI